MPSKVRRERQQAARTLAAVADWDAIRALLEETTVADTVIAETHNVHVNTLRARMRAEGWRRPKPDGSKQEELETVAIATAMKVQHGVRSIVGRSNILVQRVLETPVGEDVEKVLATQSMLIDQTAKLVGLVAVTNKLTDSSLKQAAAAKARKGGGGHGGSGAEGGQNLLVVKIFERFGPVIDEAERTARSPDDCERSEEDDAGGE